MGGWSLLAVMVGIGQDAGTLCEAVHLRSHSSDACLARECVSSAALHRCYHKQANHIHTANPMIAWHGWLLHVAETAAKRFPEPDLCARCNPILTHGYLNNQPHKRLPNA